MNLTILRVCLCRRGSLCLLLLVGSTECNFMRAILEAQFWVYEVIKIVSLILLFVSLLALIFGLPVIIVLGLILNILV